jgi:ADP-ribose pyrophosphatase
VRYRDGGEGVYAYVQRPPYAIVAAVQDGQIWMVEQWRHPFRRRMWELPMGAAPGAATPEQSARIELAEETGLRAERLTLIAEMAPAPALIAQTGTLFLAEGPRQGPQALEQGEQDLIARPWPVGEAVEAALTGRISDAVTIACLALMRLRGII